MRWFLLGAMACIAVGVLPPQEHKEPFSSLSLSAMVDQLLAAYAARSPQTARLARDSITGVQEFDDADMVNYERRTVRRGKFDRQSGTLHICTRRPNGLPLPPNIVRGVVVHEVAHAALADGRHTPEWRDMFVQLLNVATQDLGWDVALECSACAFYGLCGTECPKCMRIPCTGGGNQQTEIGGQY